MDNRVAWISFQATTIIYELSKEFLYENDYYVIFLEDCARHNDYKNKYTLSYRGQ